MIGESIFALSCICFLACSKLVEGMPLSYRQTLPENPPQQPTKSIGKQIGYIKEKLPPHLATATEMNAYKDMVISALAKSHMKLFGENVNTMVVNDLFNAKIKRAVLPEPFTSSVQLFSIKFVGRFPNDVKTNNLKCLITFELVTVQGEEDKIVSIPQKFDCNKTGGTTEPTTIPPAVATRKPSPSAESKITTKIIQLPKTVKLIKQSTTKLKVSSQKKAPGMRDVDGVTPAKPLPSKQNTADSTGKVASPSGEPHITRQPSTKRTSKPSSAKTFRSKSAAQISTAEPTVGDKLQTKSETVKPATKNVTKKNKNTTLQK